MIYFDNAATTKYKPEEVYDAATYFLKEVGVSPGRGSYSLGIDASRMLYKSRCTVGRYFGLSKPERVIFTKNSTEAINLLFNGILEVGDHVLISCYEHNAVLRPLQHLKNKGVIDYSVIARNDLSLSAEQLYKKYVKKNTKLVALTLASNLTGRIIFREDWIKYLKNKGLITFIDSSQGAGKRRLNMSVQGIDFLAFTGHKDLMAIPGVGGLCCESHKKIKPLLQGGTGIHGETYVNPDVFPEGYEAGTINMPAIWSLKTAIDYIEKNINSINEKEKMLMDYLMDRLEEVPDIFLYDKPENRVSTCCFVLKNQTSDKTISMLDQNGICARGGIHCAILAHECLGTEKTGAVRISLSFNNSKEEIDCLIKTLKNR